MMSSKGGSGLPGAAEDIKDVCV